MKKFLNEFKEFAMRGNVIDLAVGVIIGAAFQKIVTSLVDDVISPVIGIIAKTDLSNLYLVIAQKTEIVDGVEKTSDVVLRYGSFLTAIINFIIMAFVIFVLVKALNKIASLGKKKTPKESTAPTTKKCPFCMSEIDIAATRCPHCTSIIEEIAEESFKEDTAKEKVHS